MLKNLCQKANLKLDCIVLTVTTRALKHNAGIPKDKINIENITAIKEGLPNLEVHIDNLLKYTSHLIVCLNKFNNDTEDEINIIRNLCKEKNVNFEVSSAYIDGGNGAIELAKKVKEICNLENDFKPLYNFNDTINNKIEKICKEIYHANKINYSSTSLEKIEYINKLNLSNLPICIAKTQYSISDDANKLGYPKDFEVTVKDISLHTGSGFITVYLGNIVTMPGLPKNPNYENIDIDENNNIVGIF